MLRGAGNSYFNIIYFNANNFLFISNVEELQGVKIFKGMGGRQALLEYTAFWGIETEKGKHVSTWMKRHLEMSKALRKEDGKGPK